ncbi:transmembrane protein 250 [Poeciliopsis prolifica]|uniref:transmembrane protein 250 n=1 Tax=Poeciliopsis prolifica TaxID=188132 RepID=UPI0024134DCF|nr:transmembrane protein 250 [Poeciliopsis prolifica]XP_054896016.1 transmembrane protein 250 [Poeciliopsis prolifica]
MPMIPIPRRVRSFHGPHTTCMHSACGSAHTTKLVRTKYNNFDLYLRSRCMYSFLRFLLYFGCSLLTSLLWVLLSALFFLQYVSVRVLLRLQYKLSVILLLLGHRRLDFGVLNDLIIYSMHITMFLVGGLGWCFMVFVDM